MIIVVVADLHKGDKPVAPLLLEVLDELLASKAAITDEDSDFVGKLLPPALDAAETLSECCCGC